MKNAALGLALIFLWPVGAHAQQQPNQPGWPQPTHSNHPLGYIALNQNEWRAGNGDSAYRWEGEGFYGGNINRAWFKSEGNLNTATGKFDEAEVQAMYSRAVSAFYNLQAGARYDFGTGPAQAWAVLGIEGLAPYFIEWGAQAFINGHGNAAARLEASYDLPITQRLILQPQIEVNLYSKSNPARHIGAGLGTIDSGLRLRYEISRKFAPYIGVIYSGQYGEAARMAQAAGEKAHRLQFTAGVRTWF